MTLLKIARYTTMGFLGLVAVMLQTPLDNVRKNACDWWLSDSTLGPCPEWLQSLIGVWVVKYLLLAIVILIAWPIMLKWLKWTWASITKKINEFLSRPAISPLTDEQRYFRAALKAFAIYYPVRLNNCMHTVLAIVMQSEKDINRDTPNSVAFHFLLKIITNQQPDGLSYLTQLNDTKIDDLDIGEIQRNIKAFLEAYRLRQMIIGTLNEAIKVHIKSLNEVGEWMKIDDDARKDFDKLKVWSEAAETIKSENHDNKWASVGRAWQTQHKLGYA
jgi:hypothetical protein